MTVKSGFVRRYSLSFKRKVVSEIESGKLTIAEARRLYDISGGSTIQYWLRQFGKNHLLKRVVRIEMADEKSKLKQLKKEKQQLESALAQSQLRVIALENLIKAAEEELGISIKKKSGIELSKKREGK